MIVMKFGGTSLGSGERIKNVAKLIAKQQTDQSIVVVASAMSQVTNILVGLTEAVIHSASQTKLTKGIERLQKLHHQAAVDLGLEPDVEVGLLKLLDSLIAKLDDILTNIASLEELTPRANDLVISFGERLAIHLIVAALQQNGLSAVALEASELIVTDNHFGLATPLLPASRQRMRPKLQRLVDSNTIPVITGFMGATRGGVVTTLGRGGSDFSATTIGYCLEAQEVWIWTDVDGVMTADPHLISGAHTVDELSYDEAAELSYFGARVLHPRTMVPAALGNTPIWIKNSLRPQVRGTKITKATYLHPDGAKAMSVLRHLSLITVQGKGMQGVLGMAARAFTTLAEHKVNVFFISQASSENNISLVVSSADGSRAAQALRLVFRSELKVKNLETVQEEPQLAMIAVVGEGMRSHTGIAGRVFSAVGHAGINIIAIAQGSSERTISFVVSEADATRALQTIHNELHLEKDQRQKGRS